MKQLRIDLEANIPYQFTAIVATLGLFSSSIDSVVTLVAGSLIVVLGVVALSQITIITRARDHYSRPEMMRYLLHNEIYILASVSIICLSPVAMWLLFES